MTTRRLNYPASHINDPAVIATNDNVVSINSVVEVDLFGQVNSEYAGGHEFSGVGGQRDFMSGAFRSKGGQSFLAFYSTAKHGTISKIVPRIEGLLSETRMESMWFVTEYGMCNLKGKSSRERALAIIELAHPNFREGLLRRRRRWSSFLNSGNQRFNKSLKERVIAMSLILSEIDGSWE